MSNHSQESDLHQLDLNHGCSLRSDAFVIFSVTLQAVMCVLGLIGNVFVLLAIAKTRKLQTATSAYIGTLALVDLLSCLILVPSHMIGTLCGSWPLGDTTCAIAGYMMWYITCVALFDLAVIATSRYLLVAHSAASFSRICSRTHVLICLLAIWASGIFISFLPLSLLSNQGLVAMTFSTEYASCNVVVSQEILATSSAVKWVLSLPLLLFVLLGCVWIPLQFILTFCAVRKSKKRIRNFALKWCRPLRLGLTRDELRLTKILLLIYIIFLLLWMPLVMNVTLITVFSVPSEKIQKHVFTVYLVGSSLNPFIYGWLNSNFRSVFRRLISKRCFKCTFKRNPVGVMA